MDLNLKLSHVRPGKPGKGATRNATRNKCIASSNRCLTSSNKKLLGTSATLLGTGALLVVTSVFEELKGSEE